MKKILALLLALCMIFALAACGGTAAKTDGKTDGGETVLKLWCIATESDANRPAYLQAIADYEAAHPGVKIEMEAFENESYKTKIKAAMMGGDTDDLPDIFFSWSGAFLGEFVNAGRVQCLDENFKAYADKIPESMLSTTTYEGKHYGVPTTFNIVAMYANMDMLAEVGWDHVPETYEDLTACCRLLRRARRRRQDPLRLRRQGDLVRDRVPRAHHHQDDRLPGSQQDLRWRGQLERSRHRQVRRYPAGHDRQGLL